MHRRLLGARWHRRAAQVQRGAGGAHRNPRKNRRGAGGASRPYSHRRPNIRRRRPNIGCSACGALQARASRSVPPPAARAACFKRNTGRRGWGASRAPRRRGRGRSAVAAAARARAPAAGGCCALAPAAARLAGARPTHIAPDAFGGRRSARVGCGGGLLARTVSASRVPVSTPIAGESTE